MQELRVGGDDILSSCVECQLIESGQHRSEVDGVPVTYGRESGRFSDLVSRLWLMVLFFLKRSLVFPTLLFSSISLHWSLRKAFLPLLAIILWNSAFKWEYLSFSLCFLLLFFSQLFLMPTSHSHFAFLHFFSTGMVLIPVSCTMSWTSIVVHQALCLSDLVP